MPNLSDLAQSYKKFNRQLLSMKFVRLINGKMPTNCGIVTFLSRIYVVLDSFKEEKSLFFFSIFSFYVQLKSLGNTEKINVLFPKMTNRGQKFQLSTCNYE